MAIVSGNNVIKDYIKKNYGNDIFKSSKDIIERKWDILRVSPAINAMLGGGIPTGSWVNLGGKPKCGKTTTVLWICYKAQKLLKMPIYYLNVEHRLKPMNFEGLDIDHANFHMIQSSEDKILSAQDFLTIAEQILLNNSKIVMVIDSLAALTHEKELTEGIGASTRGGSAALVAQFTRQMSAVVPIKNHIILTIQQIQANTSGYGSSTVLKGGYAIGYQGDIILRERGVTDWIVGDKQVGQKVTWEADCTALGGMPGSRCESSLRYGGGIDEINELITLGKGFGLISGSSWLLLDFIEDHLAEFGEKVWDEATKSKYKTHGVEKMAVFLKENPKIADTLESDIIKLIMGK
jgi:RecA/RadA recombinase